ncbi:predicted protein [Histoplasma capsulatum var. duboisii H88]|uniref:Predicted protein n=2 Tax=Ajellomyces capsulatus TaxID=5037 RepID=F0U4P6_AJEC8|nr:predicted protein [Histoplasma capsulatum H143]EGC41993.1 predicted protein [Histoplasma capsulatum var. duboisii H88]QSS51580.1 hypothetical protein I7I53_06940 [Histoplasma capsulatum var. duboisii H88]
MPGASLREIGGLSGLDNKVFLQACSLFLLGKESRVVGIFHKERRASILRQSKNTRYTQQLPVGIFRSYSHAATVLVSSYSAGRHIWARYMALPFAKHNGSKPNRQGTFHKDHHPPFGWTIAIPATLLFYK